MDKIFHVILGQIRGLLVFFDSVVYGFIPILYKLMLYLANIDLVSNNIPIQNLIQRVYILVGVFMLFKLSFSIMNYIIDPESFSDKSKGFTNMVKRVIFALVLLVGIPWIFQEAYVVQGKILTSGIIPRLVLGEAVSYDNGTGNNYIETTIDTSARDVQFLLYGPFYSINYKAEEFSVCSPDSSNPSRHVLGSSGMASDENCLTAVAESMDKDDTVIASNVRLHDFFRYDSDTEGEPTDKRDFNSFGGLASWTTNDGEFAINYYPIVSLLCGGYLVFLLLSFCIDVAARIIRLLFLQVLSPIAVISSVDPTTSGERLKDWAKECFKTWASLFLRLIVIFLIIQLVRVLTNTIYSGNSEFNVEGFSNENGINVWIYIFLILGIFSAAKKIPELVEKATGIKMSGELELNPFKALKENAGVSLGLAGVNKGLGLATGLGMGVIGAATGAGAGRILAGAYQGLKNKNAMEVQKNMVEGNRRLRNARSDGSTLGGRMEAWATNLFGNQGALGRIEDEKVREENNIHQLENQKTSIENDIRDRRSAIQNRQEVISAIDKIKDRAYNKVKEGAQYQNSMARVEALRARAENTTNEQERTDLLRVARELEGDTERWAHNEGAQEWFNNNRNDTVIWEATREYSDAVSVTDGVDEVGYGNELWSQQDNLKRSTTDIRSDIYGQEQQIKNIDQQIQDHQNEIKRIDEEHRRVESNYKAVSGQSGGTRERNATDRTYAGQHPGPGGAPTLGPGYGPGPWGGGPGGPGHRP